MICPGCRKSQPMAYRCKSCGAELMRGRFHAGSDDAPGAAGFGTPAPAMAGGAAAAVAAPAAHNPYRTPSVAMRPTPVATGSEALASRGARLAAALLDSVFAFALLIPIFASAAMTSPGGDPAPMGTFMIIGSFVAFGAFVIYQLTILVREGQTIGKRIMKIRIVDYSSGEVPSVGKLIGMRYMVNGLLGNIPFYPIIDHLLIFGAEQRCIHDYLAGTKVVEA